MSSVTRFASNLQLKFMTPWWLHNWLIAIQCHYNMRQDHSNTMPGPIPYRSFPMLNEQCGRVPSTKSFLNGAPNSRSNKRSIHAMQPTIGLAPPAKLARVQDEKESPWTCTPSTKASRTGKNDSMEKILKPIIDNIKPGFKRDDKKDPIALAVRQLHCDLGKG